MQCHTQCPRPCSRPLLTHASARDSWTLRASLGQSLVGSLLLSPGSWFAQGFVCALQEPVSPVLCKFWQLYSAGVNSDLLQEGLCHTQGCCTQSPCPCGRPVLTCTFAGDTQTLKGRSGSVSVGSPDAYKVLFEPSKHLWWVWGLILNPVLPFLLSCWGFSFAFGCGLSLFFGGIQHSPVDGCSAASCNFGVLTGEDESASFYSVILIPTEAVIKIAGRNVNKLRYADDTTLMAESEEELKSLLVKVKEESEKLA